MTSPDANPQIPELVSLTEASDIFGFTRERVRVLAQRPEFPLGYTLAMGTLYRPDEIEEFKASDWNRGTGGRPRKGTPQPRREKRNNPNIPRIVGVAEIAAKYGFSRGTAHNRTKLPGFPRGRNTYLGMVWLEEEVDAYFAEHPEVIA